MKINTLKMTMALLLVIPMALTSCKKEDTEVDPITPAAKSMTYNYEFNNGQVVASAAYDGTHKDDMTAKIKVEENSDGKANITVTLNNTINGETYRIHSHDAADPATTPNGTPYNETPNSAVFAQMLMGNGGTVSATQEVDMEYDNIINTYSGFFVVHDPLQTLNTADISTYLVVGSFARAQTATNYASSEFTYDFNTGQVAPSFAYDGAHASTLSGVLTIDELADGGSRVSVRLNNTLNNETYHTHAHDAADPATTPNNTPYDETPNANVCAMMISGNGGMAYNTQISTESYADLTTNYSGFFVVHDPLQAINTADPTTYVLLGSFAR